MPSRQEQLESLISDLYNLINEHERKLLVIQDPIDRARYTEQKKDLIRQKEEYERELEEIEDNTYFGSYPNEIRVNMIRIYKNYGRRHGELGKPLRLKMGEDELITLLDEDASAQFTSIEESGEEEPEKKTTRIKGYRKFFEKGTVYCYQHKRTIRTGSQRSESVRRGDRTSQVLEYKEVLEALAVTGEIAKLYREDEEIDEPSNKIAGFPRTEQLETLSADGTIGYYQYFEGIGNSNTVICSSKCGTFWVIEKIAQYYEQLNGPKSKLKFPKSKHVYKNRGGYQEFEGGKVYWLFRDSNPNNEGIDIVKTVRIGPFLDFYISLGETESELGFPVKDSPEIIDFDRPYIQDFENGQILIFGEKRIACIGKFLPL